MRPEFNKNNWTYYIKDGAAIITNVPKPHSKTLSVPSTFQNYPVEEIEFYDSNIHAYKYTSIRLPRTLKRFNATCFSEYVESISVDPASEHFLSKDGILYSKDGKTLVCFPAEKKAFNPSCLDNVEVIGDGAFSCCNCLTEVTLPESVTDIGDYAFANCENLRSIHIPDSVTHIGKAVFTYNSLQSIRLSKNTKKLEPAYEFDSEGEGFFQGSPLEKITLPETLEKIGYFTFNECRKLKEIHIPASVKVIEDCAFHECSALEKITVSKENENYYSTDGVLYSKNGKLILYPQNKQDTYYKTHDTTTNISPHAFLQSRNLKELVLSDNIETLGFRAFAGSQIEKISLSRKMTSLDYGVFLDFPSLKELYIPKETNLIKINSNICGNLDQFKNIMLLVEKDSYAERMCIENQIKYTIVSNQTTQG